MNEELVLELVVHFLKQEDYTSFRDEYPLLKVCAFTCKRIASLIEDRRVVLCYRRAMTPIHGRIDLMHRYRCIREGGICLRMIEDDMLPGQIPRPLFTRKFRLMRPGIEFFMGRRWWSMYTSGSLSILHTRNQLEEKPWLRVAKSWNGSDIVVVL